jgi:hypothetical protein
MPVVTNLGTLLMSTTHVTIITVAMGQIVPMVTVIYHHIATVTFSSSVRSIMVFSFFLMFSPSLC